MGKILNISEQAPERALEQLCRLTGLDFGHYPTSLLEAPVSNGEVDSIRRQALALVDRQDDSTAASGPAGDPRTAHGR